jgi:hypothetical protein
MRIADCGLKLLEVDAQLFGRSLNPKSKFPARLA